MAQVTTLSILGGLPNFEFCLERVLMLLILAVLGLVGCAWIGVLSCLFDKFDNGAHGSSGLSESLRRLRCPTRVLELGFDSDEFARSLNFGAILTLRSERDHAGDS